MKIHSLFIAALLSLSITLPVMAQKDAKPVRMGCGIMTFDTVPGWGLRPELAEFDAEKRFDVGHIQTQESELCIAGQILQGQKKPNQCPAFGSLCLPERPLGAPMVSTEGACSAFYRYGRSG